MAETSYRQHRFRRPPGATEILLVRHGESEPAVPGRPFPLVDGHGDPALAPEGHVQADAVGRRLADQELDAIYVTTLRRTVETAAPLVALTGLQPRVELLNLFGFVGTGSAEAAAAVARQEGTVLFAPFAASDALRDPSISHVFHVRPSLADEAFKMVRHCATLGQNRIAVVAEDDAMGRAGLAAVQQALQELKLPPLVGSAFVPVSSDKVDAAVAQLAKAQPHAIIQVSLFTTTAAFIRKMRKTGYVGAFMNFSVVGIDPLWAALGKEIGGVVISQVVPSPRSSATPIVKEYLAAIDNSDQTASYEGLEGFIAAKSLNEAVRRAGRSIDKGGLQKALASMSDYDVGGFRINLRAGVRDSARSIDLVTITADGKVVR